MINIHLDTDIGGDPDDVCALGMLLKRQGIKFTGITTVADDKGKRAGFVKHVLKIAKREEIPVKAGADVLDGYFMYKPDYPNEIKYWQKQINPSPNPVDEALELLKSNIEQKAIIICIGQLTNLFLLDKKYPGILKDTNLYFMGGYIYPIRDGYPQWDNSMDYNVQLDPNAAKYVLENANITLIPLTMSVETALRRIYLPALKKSDKIGQLIALQAEAHNDYWNNEEKIGKQYKGLPSDILNFQHDPLACAIALGYRDGVEVSEITLKFEIKDKLLHETINPNGIKIKVVTKIDGNKFNQF